MWKNSVVEDEIPLTYTTSNVTQETRARFDSLLLAALGQETQKGQKKDEKHLQGENIPERKQKSASRKSKQRNTETNVSSSESRLQHSKEEEVIRAHKDDSVILNKKLKNETNESKASHVKSTESAKDTHKTENEIHAIDVKSVSTSPFGENLSKHREHRPKAELRKPVPLPRKKPPEAHKEVIPEDCFKETLNPNRSDGDDLLNIFKHEQSLNNEPLPKTERKKKKHKNKDENNETEIELQQFRHTDSPSASIHRQRAKEAHRVAEAESGNPSTTENNTEKIIGVHIHKSDFLEVDPLVTHPIVKVNLLDGATGNYLKKSMTQRPASFFYENEDLDYILPLMTEAFQYKMRRSLIPQWEELLIFNENFEYILRDDVNALILFEIIDFVNFEIASSRYRKLGAEGGWHRIAWAFLKPVGANGILNVNKQVRLQLYKPWKTPKNNCGECDVYQWWISGKWEKYPATLYVTLQGISPPEQQSPVLRSRSVLQGELSEDIHLELEHSDEKELTKPDNEGSLAASLLSMVTQPNNVPIWSRLPLQACQIPNKCRALLPTASKGCFTLQFSNNGLFLACATVGEEKFDIIVYTIPEGKLFTTLSGHLGLVYEVGWSSNDSVLVSASADCTACLWNMEQPTSQTMQMLPHPSFVYSAVFHPGNNSILATGCCDHVIRIWSKPRKSLHYELTQELEGHSGFINTVAINILNNAMYTGDSKGGIIEWMTTKVKPKRIQMQWKLNRKLDIKEIEDTVVNRLVLHPRGKRLLIHARDSRLRMLDIATGTLIQWYSGALNHRFQTQACISPCGGLVISGSEDGTVYVWQTDTGEQLAVYSGLQFQRAANAVHYHPHEHMAAFGSYGSPAQVIVCSYDSKSSGKEISLQIISHKDKSHTSKASSSKLERIKLSGMQKDNAVQSSKHSSGVFTDSRSTVEETISVCSTGISTVKLTSILEKMERILQNSSSYQKATESPDSK